jgi:hypothetical protein
VVAPGVLGRQVKDARRAQLPSVKEIDDLRYDDEQGKRDTHRDVPAEPPVTWRMSGIRPGFRVNFFTAKTSRVIQASIALAGITAVRFAGFPASAARAFVHDQRLCIPGDAGGEFGAPVRARIPFARMQGIALRLPQPHTRTSGTAAPVGLGLVPGFCHYNDRKNPPTLTGNKSPAPTRETGIPGTRRGKATADRPRRAPGSPEAGPGRSHARASDRRLTAMAYFRKYQVTVAFVYSSRTRS